MATYDTYPAVDENYNFPPPVRLAIANSVEVGDRVEGKLDAKIQAGEFEGFAGLIPDPDDPGVFIPVGKDDLADAAEAIVNSAPIYAGEVPAYAATGAAGTPRMNSYSKELALYNGESPELVTMRWLMGNAIAGRTRCRAVAIGDSRTVGPLPGASTPQPFSLHSWPAQLRDMLSATEGEFYFDEKDNRFSAISGLTQNANPDAHYMTTVLNQATSITVALPVCSGFDLWAFRSGSTEVMSIAVDGAAPVTFAPGSGASWKKHSVRGLSLATHTVVITVPALSAGSFSLSRIAPYYAATGLTISNAGRSSSRPLDWDVTTWDKVMPTITGLNADFPDVAFIQLGTNWTTSTYDNLTSIVNKLRAVNCKIMLISFGPRQEDTTDPVFNQRRDMLYDLADHADLPLLDNLQVVGPWDVANGRALFDDTVHESLKGLSLEAAALKRALAL